MAKLTRAFQKIFCGDVTPVNNVAVFGSLKAGAPSFSSDPDTIQSLPAFTQGWTSAVVLNQAPAMQDMNALQFLFSRQIAYLMQMGIPEYLDTETYYIGSLVQNSGKIYISLTNSNVGNALTTSNWGVVFTKQISSVSANYTVLKDDFLVKATGSSVFTITLPQAVSANAGEEHKIKSNMTAGVFVNVAAAGGSLIDGQTIIQLSKNDSMSVVSDGSQWMVI